MTPTSGSRGPGARLLPFALLPLLSCSAAGGGRASGPAIGAIQGAGHSSPVVGREVAEVRGVVTSRREGGGRNGFFLQDAAGDGDPATSDAIFVSTGELPPAVAPGDLVAVAGRVEEVPPGPGQLPVTRIAAAPVVGTRVIESGVALPPPVRLGRGGRAIPDGVIDDDGLARFEPAADGIDFWESLEGMRVELADPAVVGPTTEYRETAVLAAGAEGGGARTWRGGIARHGERENPQVVLVQAPRGLDVEAAVGDRFLGPLAGIVEYDFGAYRLALEAPVPALARAKVVPQATRLSGDEAHLTVATFNVENLSVSGPAERFDRAARVLVEALGGPDVVALQEVQDDSGPDDDGTVTAEATMAALAEAVARAGGPEYRWVQLDPRDNEDGGRPGGNIRVAVLYAPERVELVRRGDPAAGEAAVGPDGRVAPVPGRLGVDAPCFAETRKPLVVELAFGGRPVVVVANHWSSKGDDDRAFGAVQPPRRHSEVPRTCQAETVAALVRRLLAADPEAAVVVLGDLNEHEDRPPVEALRAAGLEVLVDRVEPARRYTYVYRGISQVLDHIAVSRALAAGAEVDILHVDADHPAAGRASDHDPVVARLRVEAL